MIEINVSEFEINESMIIVNERMIQVIKEWLIWWIKSMNKWLQWPVLDICLGDVCVLVAHVRDSCVQDVCVRNALCPSAVVLQRDVIVLDDCVPEVFVMGAFRGCRFCVSGCIMYVCRRYILDVCVFDDCVAVVGVQHLCVFNAQIWNVCLQNFCDQFLFGKWLCGFNILFLMGSFVLDASLLDLRILNGWVQFVCLQDFCAGWMFIG